jgi:hypothetical protein
MNEQSMGERRHADLAPIREPLINFARYPIDRLESVEGQKFLSISRTSFASDGVLLLKDFLVADAVRTIVDEVLPLRSMSYCRPHQANAYLSPEEGNLPSNHARNRSSLTNLGVVADDRIPSGSRIRDLYTAPVLLEFLATVLGYPALFPYADLLGSLNINFAGNGQQLGWHFDNSDFAATLLLQVPERGGTFEYVPRARTDADPGFSAVTRAFDDDRSVIRTLDQGPGSLVLFRGRHSLHRVTAVEGETPRVIAVLVYDTEPGVKLTEFNRQLLYGRLG